MQRSNEKAEVFTEIVLGVFRMNGLLLDLGDEMTRPAGLTGARWQVLGIVDHGPASVSQVARTMGLTRQGVQRTADILARDGMILYVENPDHQRAKLMEITAEGKEALGYVEERQVEWANRVSAEASLEELRITAEIIKELTEVIDREEA